MDLTKHKYLFAARVAAAWVEGAFGSTPAAQQETAGSNPAPPSRRYAVSANTLLNCDGSRERPPAGSSHTRRLYGAVAQQVEQLRYWMGTVP